MGTLVSLALVRQPVKEKENSEFKSVKLCLKIGLVSHPACAEGVGKYIYKKDKVRKKISLVMRINAQWNS